MRRRGRRRGRRFVVAISVVALGTGGVALARSTLFSLSEIQVVGASSTRAVLDAAGVDVGTNVLGIDVEEIEARVRGMLGVASADVVRTGSLSLRITVVERRPALEVRAGDTRWFLDQLGDPIDAPAEADLPVLSLAAVPDGDVPAIASEVVAVWRALPRDTRALVRDFEDAGGAVAFRLDGVRVVFGTADRAEEKVAVVRRILAAAGSAREVDVRVPERPTARLR